MMRQLVLAVSLFASLTGSASAVATPAATPPATVNSVAIAGSPSLSPVLDYLFNGPNQANLTVFSQAIIAGALEQYFNQTNLSVTMFVPTDAAMNYRLNFIQQALNITRADLFSYQKQFVLSEILKYHVIPFQIAFSDLTNGEQYATLSNLCSNSKDLSSVRVGNVVTMVSAGGTNGTIIANTGVDVKSSATSTVVTSMYFIDDVLLPSVVTIPLANALAPFTSGFGGPNNAPDNVS